VSDNLHPGPFKTEQLCQASCSACSTPHDCNAGIGDACASCSCSNGQCSCAGGYSGAHCQTPLCKTRSDCSNHGDCNAGTAGVACKCDKGYSGVHCEKPNIDVTASPSPSRSVLGGPRACDALCCEVGFCQQKLGPGCPAIASTCCKEEYSDRITCNNCLTATARANNIPATGLPVGNNLQVVSIFGNCSSAMNGAQDFSNVAGCNKKNCGECVSMYCGELIRAHAFRVVSTSNSAVSRS
jgi:hypothetical protein